MPLPPGKGVGVIGQCFSGGFALAAAVDDSVLAPVLSQPSVPLALTPAMKRDPGVSEREMAVIEKRAADEGLCALGLRFSGDPMAPAERFATLKRLGDNFEVIEIDSGRGNPEVSARAAHSVLTVEVGGPRVIRPTRPVSGWWSSSGRGWCSQPGPAVPVRVKPRVRGAGFVDFLRRKRRLDCSGSLWSAISTPR